MEKNCDNCFYEKRGELERPCFTCNSYSLSNWVAVDFLKDVDEGNTVMEQMIEQLNRVKPVQAESSLNKQVSGNHYKGFKIQPIEFIHANNIPFAEGCAIKYLTRWRDKGGVSDLEKAKHFIELLIELESRE